MNSGSLSCTCLFIPSGEHRVIMGTGRAKDRMPRAYRGVRHEEAVAPAVGFATMSDAGRWTGGGAAGFLVSLERLVSRKRARLKSS